MTTCTPKSCDPLNSDNEERLKAIFSSTCFNGVTVDAKLCLEMLMSTS